METYLEYARRGRNSWWRYVLGCIVAVVIFMASALVAGLALMLSGVVTQAGLRTFQQQMASPKSPAMFFAANGVVFGLLAAGLAIAAAWLNGKTPLDLLGRWRWKDYAAGAAIWLAAMIALSLVDVAIAPSAFRFNGSAATAGLAGWALAGLAIQTFAEEYVFRGYLTQGLLQGLKAPLPAALISGVLFGALHVPNGWPQALNAVVLGVCLSLIAIRTGGVAFGCGLHLVNNLFGATVLVSSSDVFNGSPALFVQNSPQLMWWDVILSSLAIAAITFAGLRRPQTP